MRLEYVLRRVGRSQLVYIAVLTYNINTGRSDKQQR